MEHGKFRLIIIKHYLFQEISKIGEELGITPMIIKGEQLNEKGFGGMCCTLHILLFMTLYMFCFGFGGCAQ